LDRIPRGDVDTVRRSIQLTGNSYLCALNRSNEIWCGRFPRFKL
jgi:hypothetical protein